MSGVTGSRKKNGLTSLSFNSPCWTDWINRTSAREPEQNGFTPRAAMPRWRNQKRNDALTRLLPTPVSVPVMKIVWDMGALLPVHAKHLDIASVVAPQNGVIGPSHAAEVHLDVHLEYETLDTAVTHQHTHGRGAASRTSSGASRARGEDSNTHQLAHTSITVVFSIGNAIHAGSALNNEVGHHIIDLRQQELQNF